ncbi:MAG: acetylglutamate kinase [Bacteroidota bacterium]
MLSILKIGGKVLEQPALREQVLRDWTRNSMQRLLVHGGGKTASDISQKLGIKAPMIQGRRITSPDMLKVALMVYGGLMNRQLVATLQALGASAFGMTGADLDVIRAIKRPVKDIDYGLAGDIVSVQTDSLKLLIENGHCPVLAPLTHDGKGQLLNTNADTIASAVASALADTLPVQLTYVFEQPGVMADIDNPDSLVSVLAEADYDQLKEGGAIHSGMIPKLDNAFRALQAGVKEVQICRYDAVAGLGSTEFVGTKLML